MAPVSDPRAARLPKRDVPELIAALRDRARALTGVEWERNATRAMMFEAADQLEALVRPEGPATDMVSREKYEAAVSLVVPLGCEHQPHLSRTCQRGTRCCGIDHDSVRAEGPLETDERPNVFKAHWQWVEGTGWIEQLHHTRPLKNCQHWLCIAARQVLLGLETVDVKPPVVRCRFCKDDGTPCARCGAEGLSSALPVGEEQEKKA